MRSIGIDIGGTNIKAALVEQAGRSVLRRASHETRAEGGPDAVLEQIHAAIASVLEGDSRDSVTGIGIGVPGSIDFDRGLVLHPPNLPGWTEVPLAALVNTRWGLPVWLDNDANCAALGEAYFGAGRGRGDFIALTLGTGVGSGIVMNGRIHHGERGFGGEFGHMTIDYNGPLCGCGNCGCVEAYVGNSFLAARAVSALAQHPESPLYELSRSQPDELTPRHIAEAAAAGDNCAFEILHDTGVKLGVAVASAANLLDITTFIIGGGVAAAGKPLFDGVIASANSRVLRVHQGHVTVVPAELGNEAGVLGAASLTN